MPHRGQRLYLKVKSHRRTREPWGFERLSIVLWSPPNRCIGVTNGKPPSATLLAGWRPRTGIGHSDNHHCFAIGSRRSEGCTQRLPHGCLVASDQGAHCPWLYVQSVSYQASYPDASSASSKGLNQGAAVIAHVASYVQRQESIALPQSAGSLVRHRCGRLPLPLHRRRHQGAGWQTGGASAEPSPAPGVCRRRHTLPAPV